MRIGLTACLALFAGLSVSARQTFKIWGETDMTGKQWSTLSVFLPEKPDSSGVSVVICPGGSYYWLAMDNEGFSVAEYLARQGIAAFVLRYRTARDGNHYPAMIEDLERAVQIVKDSSGKWGIDPGKVGVMGFSAGGHLAGMAAIYSKLPLRPYFAAMIYPVVSMEDSICHKKSRRNLLGSNYSDELKHRMSLEENVHGDMPPVFLLACTGDRTVDCRNSMAFDKALTDKNVKHEFLLFDESRRGGHGFGIRPVGKTAGWIDEFLRWLKTL